MASVGHCIVLTFGTVKSRWTGHRYVLYQFAAVHLSPQPFYGPFSGTTRVSRCQKRTYSGLHGAREDNKRQTPTIRVGTSPFRLISNPPPSMPPIFMRDALPAATLPIYPGLGQAQKYAGLHAPVAWLTVNLSVDSKPVSYHGGGCL